MDFEDGDNLRLQNLCSFFLKETVSTVCDKNSNM